MKILSYTPEPKLEPELEPDLRLNLQPDLDLYQPPERDLDFDLDRSSPIFNNAEFINILSST